MRRIVILITYFSISIAVSGQQAEPAPVLTKQDYQEKSRTQKKTGTILLAGGSVISAIGLGIALGNLNGLFDPNQPEPDNNGKLADALGYSGLVIAASGIPFFIASSKNKKKAMSMSLDNQVIPKMQSGNFVYCAVPSVKLMIRL